MRPRVLVPKVHRYVLSQLASEIWRDGRRVPSTRQLALRLKVSQPIVQMAYRQACRDGLLDVQPSRAARVTAGAAARAQALLATQARSEGRRLAILIPNKYFPLTGAPFQRRLAHETCLAATARGSEAAIVPVPDGDHAEFAQQVIRRYDAAFVIEMRTANIPLVFALTEQRFPVLLFNRHVAGLAAPSLNTDDYGAARKLAEAMRVRGHRNLCLLSNTVYESLLGEHGVTDGWIDFLEETGAASECIMPLAFTKPRQIVTVFQQLLALRPRITAFVLGMPILLTRLATHPQLQHLRVPEELSIATTGSMRSIVFPPEFPSITSFEIDWDRAGHCAVEMIDRMLAGEPQPKDIRVPLNLQLTESIGPPPA
ncbi:MAG: substrate-binding domain-containing protein [Phycisphaerae bacterium]|nr:substrate-binding domain-containing protein [Phycisphaerae bacterium]